MGVNEFRNIFYFFRGIVIKRHILQFSYTVYLSIRIMCVCAHVWIRARVYILVRNTYVLSRWGVASSVFPCVSLIFCSWFQASAAMLMRSALFLNLTQP